MRIGVFVPSKTPFSVEVCIKNLTRELKLLGVEIEYFFEYDVLPTDADIYWDPRSVGGSPPYEALKYAKKPVVVTVHGAAPLSMPAREFYASLPGAIIGKLQSMKNLYRWRSFQETVSAVITVSNYAKEEIVQCLCLNPEKVFPVYHGIDDKLFYPGQGHADDQLYLLHVSAYQPKKNLHRIIQAYRRLQLAGKPKLIAVVPGYNGKGDDEVEIISTAKSCEELALLYRKALGFIFPSLHESFGMPIVEAMACGCPVITSRTTGCQEVAEDAALLVDPRSVEEIASAMKRLIEDEKLRGELRMKGLERARMFTWQKAAMEHLKVFKRVIGNA